MVGMSTYDESLHPRHATGQFATKTNDAPNGELSNPRADLDVANAAYQGNAAELYDAVKGYLRVGMPHEAHRVEFEASDQGDYVYAARAFTEDGTPIDTEDDFDRWADVDEIVELLGHPDDNRPAFGELFTSTGRGVYAWTRTEPTDDAEEGRLRERIDALTAQRRQLGNDSQAGAITAVRNMVPDGATVTFGWSDQGDFLAVDKVTLADGTEIEWDNAEDHGIEWDELDVIASDIRDAGDPALTEVPGSHGHRFTLTKTA